MNEPNRIYLKQAELKGFRTIVDVQTDFQPGLNIIIGKNGVGKSNFVKYLYRSLAMETMPMNHHDSHLDFERDQGIPFSIHTRNRVTGIRQPNVDVIKDDHPFKVTVEIGDKQRRFSLRVEVDVYLFQEDCFYSPVLISHGLPRHYPLVDTPLTIKANPYGATIEGPERDDYPSSSFFLQDITKFLLLRLITAMQDGHQLDKEYFEEILRQLAKLLEPVKVAMEKYSDVQDLRISPNVNTAVDTSTPECTLGNLFLEFKIRGQWLPFAHLSDGTRRVFYIISEMAYHRHRSFTDNDITVHPPGGERIVLFEEPELGLHPHQLEILLHFIDEMSKEIQVILTTHAPQVLDILDKEQLDRITIARISKKGTLLRHLTAKERKKAALYMEEEAYLSDYWRFSDLEN